jgi:hypothetical protein
MTIKELIDKYGTHVISLALHDFTQRTDNPVYAEMADALSAALEDYVIQHHKDFDIESLGPEKV